MWLGFVTFGVRLKQTIFSKMTFDTKIICSHTPRQPNEFFECLKVQRSFADNADSMICIHWIAIQFAIFLINSQCKQHGEGKLHVLRSQKWLLCLFWIFNIEDCCLPSRRWSKDSRTKLHLRLNAKNEQTNEKWKEQIHAKVNWFSKLAFVPHQCVRNHILGGNWIIYVVVWKIVYWICTEMKVKGSTFNIPPTTNQPKLVIQLRVGRTQQCVLCTDCRLSINFAVLCAYTRLNNA